VITKPDDLAGLVPSFRARVETLLQRMRARGFSPVVVDGRRTAAEARANAVKGTGIVGSLHLWGVAADFADRDTEWADPKFFDALGEEALKVGLYWGGRWTKPDRPHTQGVPATTRAQSAVRACRVDDVSAVEAVVRRWMR
jgi:D-alanyl-D-alanine carboxypeptidase